MSTQNHQDTHKNTDLRNGLLTNYASVRRVAVNCVANLFGLYGMASIRKLKSGYRAEVYVKGKRTSKVCRTKSEAQEWARQQEINLSSTSADIEATLADLWQSWVIRYPERKQIEWETRRLKYFQRYEIANVRLTEITGKHVANWRDERLQEVSADTVLRDWNLLSSICTDAIKEMGWLTENPFSKAKRPASSPARTRIPTDDELEKIWQHCMPHIERVARFAIATGMRQGEIAKLTWEMIDGNVANLPVTKNGKPRSVPLAKLALALLPKTDTNPVFGLTASQIESQWRKTVRRAGLEGIRFHDLRALAATQLSKKLDPYELCKMFGWSDMKLALRYYRKSASDIAASLD